MKYLFSTPLPEAATTNEDTSLGQQLSRQGLVDSSDTVVTPLASEAADLTLEGQYRWGERVSTMLANELKALGDSGLSNLPLFRRNGEFANAGYYEIESADIEPLHSNRRDVWKYTLSLTDAGTRGSRWREVATSRAEVTNPFGSTEAGLVGVPAAAKQARWYDRSTWETGEATPVETRSAELGDVVIYDTTDAPFDDPSLVYDIAYEDEGPVDVNVFDERDTLHKLDESGIRQWHKRFQPSAEFDGEAIIDNGLVRLRFDTDASDLVVEHWDSNGEAWNDQALGDSSWEFQSLDIRTIGFAQVHARVEFADPSANPTSYHTLDCWLARGYQNPLWGTDSTMPTGLVDLLSPVAADQVYEPGPDKGLIKGSEI